MANVSSVGKRPQQNLSDNHTRCGYVIHDMEKMLPRFLCSYCQYIIKEPYQLIECGHRVCKGCFESRSLTTSMNEMVCPNPECLMTFIKTQFMVDRAFKRELDSMKVACCHKMDENCAWSGVLKEYQEHLDQTHVNYECQACKHLFPTKRFLANHIDTECPATFSRCLLAPYCTEDMIHKSKFLEHLLSNKHQEVIALIAAGKINFDVAMEQDQEQDMECDNKINELQRDVTEKLSTLYKAVQQLNDETLRSSEEFIRLSELTQAAEDEIAAFQEACNSKNALLADLQEKQLLAEKELDTLREWLDNNDIISTDGTLVWRIDNVTQRMADAQSERQTSIYSPIFYSSPTGYKMRARLYLYGDGIAKRTHISMFFLLMKGDYDALLPWPFGYKVTFCLFDQTGKEHHHIDSFRPDTKSSSFQRPTNDANTASGIPKFCALSIIQQDENSYVRNDTMFLKIFVDLHETPKTALHFAMKLNPGLPYYTRQSMIKKEIKNLTASASNSETTSITTEANKRS